MIVSYSRLLLAAFASVAVMSGAAQAQPANPPNAGGNVQSPPQPGARPLTPKEKREAKPMPLPGVNGPPIAPPGSTRPRNPETSGHTSGGQGSPPK